MTEIEILTERFKEDLFNLTGDKYHVKIKRYEINNKIDYSVSLIIDTVCDYFKIDSDLLKQKTRKREIIDAKFICYYLIKTNCYKLSLKEIADVFDMADHSNVVHGLKQFHNHFDTNKQFKQDVDNIEKLLLDLKNIEV